MKKQQLNPLMQAAVKTPVQETEQAIAIQEKMESLAEMHEKLVERQREVALDSRKRDLDIIEKLASVVENILDPLMEETSKPELKKAIEKIVAAGDFKKLREIMHVVDSALERREALLGFDETREDNRKKCKLRFLFKGKDGSMAGTEIELT
jgi:23S rRNA maturation mini-RNase III